MMVRIPNSIDVLSDRVVLLVPVFFRASGKVS